jgi:acyl-CoA thioesterase
MKMTALPFIDHVGLVIRERASGSSRCTLAVAPHHFNSFGAVHGAALFALADTGMGAALVGTLERGETCATIEVKINYFKPVTGGEIECATDLVHRGRTIAHLESTLTVAGVLVAKANGTYAILRPGRAPADRLG